MLDLLAWIIGIILLTRGTTTLFFLEDSLSWFRRNNKHNKETLEGLPTVTFIIACLREQKRIVDTLDYFLKSFGKYPIHIIVATTQREFEKTYVGLSTQELVSDYIKRNMVSNKVRIINYPKNEGKKAHQLNYVLKVIKDKTDFIAVYDADSRPHKLTLDAFYYQINLYPEAEVFQQSALFINNYKMIKNPFLRASAILQSRWTLAHEVARLLRQSNNKTIISNLANAHCVGHGLIIRPDTLNSVGGFSEKTINEDLILGYLLRIKGVKIYPLPFLELADAPETLKGLWNQKYVWFWGPLRYIEYYKTAVERFRLNFKNRVRAMILASQGLLSALAWLLSGPMFLTALILIVTTSDVRIKLILIFGVIIYGPAQFIIIARSFKEFQDWAGQELESQTWLKLIETALMSIPAILFNSIPPYFALFAELKYIIQNKEIYKPKTDD